MFVVGFLCITFFLFITIHVCKAIKRCRSTADTSHNYNSQGKSGVKGCLINAVVIAARYIPLLSTASPEVWLVIPKIQPYVWPFIIKTQLNEAAESCSYYNVKSELLVGIEMYVKLMDSPLLYASAFTAWKVFSAYFLVDSHISWDVNEKPWKLLKCPWARHQRTAYSFIVSELGLNG